MVIEEVSGKVAISLIAEIFKSSAKGLMHLPRWVKQKSIDYDLFGSAARKYCRQVEQRYNFVKIFGMNEPINLRDIYIRLRIQEMPSANRRYSIDQLRELFHSEARRVQYPKEGQVLSALKVFNTYDKVVVLGKPGSGKTTLLKHTALAAIDGRLKEKVVPVVVSFNEWSDSSLSLIKFIESEFDICGLPSAQELVQNLLTDGKLLLLLDGLDEVTSNIDRTIKELNQAVAKHRTCKFIVSCRIAAQEYVLPHFKEVEIADFDQAQIEAFSMSWFRADRSKGTLFFSRLRDTPQINELAAIPLLLTLFCIVFDELMDFPSNRAELYKEAIDALLKRWDASRGIKRDVVYKHLSLMRKEQMLSRIASLLFDSDKYFVPRRILEGYISEYMSSLPNAELETLSVDSEAVLRSIEAQHGLLVERAKGIYSFSHLTIQEYFTARYAVSNEGKGSLQTLIDEKLTQEKYREVFLLVAGMLPDASDLLIKLRKRMSSISVHQNLQPIIAEIMSIKKRDIFGPVLRSIFLYDVMVRVNAGDDRLFTGDRGIALCARIIKRIAKLAKTNKQVVGADKRQQVLDLKEYEKSAAIAETMVKGTNVWAGCALDAVIEYLYATDLLLECLSGEVVMRMDLRSKLISSILVEPAVLN